MGKRKDKFTDVIVNKSARKHKFTWAGYVIRVQDN